MKSNTLVIKAVQCPECLDVIFSRARHDFRSCSCKRTAIDGGRDYQRALFKDSIHFLQIEGLALTPKDMEKDWALGKDIFGLHKTKKIVYDILYRYTLNSKGKFYRTKKSGYQIATQ